MTKNDKARQIVKLTALNKLRKLYHPLTKHDYTAYDGDERSTNELMSNDARWIIEALERDLDKLKENS